MNDELYYVVYGVEDDILPEEEFSPNFMPLDSAKLFATVVVAEWLDSTSALYFDEGRTDDFITNILPLYTNAIYRIDTLKKIDGQEIINCAIPGEFLSINQA